MFAKRVIEAGEMVIEYSGELIRAILTDKRENNYKVHLRLYFYICLENLFIDT